MKNQKALVLLSGGQDSTTCLYWAKREFSQVEAVSFDYGQRHSSEKQAAERIAGLAGVKRTVLSVPALREIGDSALVDGSQQLTGSGGRVDSAMPQGLPSSFVPGRNMIFLATAAALAVKVGAQVLVAGVCQTDYSGYPDCRESFIYRMHVAINEAMPSSCRLYIETPLMHLSKADTVRLAKDLPGCWDALALTVTCYNGEQPRCGTCPACLVRAKGFTDAGMLDPALWRPLRLPGT